MMLFRKVWINVFLFFVLSGFISAKTLDCSERFAPIVVDDIVTMVPYVTDECRMKSILEKIEKFALYEYKVEVPTLQDYKDIGINGVTSYNIQAINKIIADGYPTDVDTIAKLRILVNKVIAKHYLVGKFEGVKGVTYETSSGLKGTTGSDGSYKYNSGDDVTFSVAEAELGTVKSEKLISVFDFKRADFVAQILYSLDKDKNENNGLDVSHINQKKFKSLNRNVRNKTSNSKILVDSMVLGDNDYTKYLNRYNANIRSRSEVLTAEFVKILNIKPQSQKGTGTARTIAGSHYSGLLSLHSRGEAYENKVKQLYNQKKYDYRIKIAALDKFHMYMTGKISQKAENVILEADSREKRYDEGFKKVSAGMAILFQAAQAGIDASKGKVNKALIESGALSIDILSELAKDGKYSPEVKLATSIAVNCMAQSTKNTDGCVVDAGNKAFAKLLTSSIDDPEDIKFINTVSGLTTNIEKAVVSCAKFVGTKDKLDLACVKDATTAAYESTWTLLSTAWQIKELAKGGQALNNFRIAYEIFSAQIYLGIEPGIDQICDLIPYYEDKRNTADLNKRVEKCTKDNDKEKIWHIVQAFEYNGLGKEIINDVYFSDYSQEKVLDYFYNFLGGIIQPSFKSIESRYSKYYDKFKGKNRKINELTANHQITKELTIKSAKAEVIINKDKTVNINIPFSFKNRLAMKDITASIDISADDSNVLSMKIKNLTTGPTKNGSFDASIDDFALSELYNDKTFFTKVTINYKIYQNISDTLFANNFYKLYKINNLNIEPSFVEITGTNDRNKKIFFIANIKDNRGLVTPKYKFKWTIDSAGCSTKNFTSDGVLDSRRRFLYYIDDECKGNIVYAKVEVLDADNDNGIIATQSMSLDPIVEKELRLTCYDKNLGNGKDFTIEPSIIGLTTGKLSFSMGSDLVKVSEGKLSAIYHTDNTESTTAYTQVDVTLTQDARTLHCTSNIQIESASVPVEQTINIQSKYNIPSKENFTQKNPGDIFIQSWGLWNTGIKTLKNVVLKERRGHTLLKHVNIKYLGDIKPRVSFPVKIEITVPSDVPERKHLGIFDLYYTDKNGDEKRLNWDNGKGNASLIYRIMTEKKDINPPYIVENSVTISENKTVTGIFNIEQVNKKVKNLRVYFSSTRSFSNSESKFIDIGSDYDAIQNSGYKNFTYDASDWSGNRLYWKIKASNQYGYRMINEPTGVFYLDNPVVDNKPSISITTSGSSSSNNPKTGNFTLSVRATDDKGLKKIVYGIQRSSGGSALKTGYKYVSGKSATASFTIDVNSLAVGSYRVVVGVSDTKNQTSSAKVYYFQKKAVVVDNKPSISITTSGSSSSNNPKTGNFTLSVRATDDKGLKKIVYGLKEISGSNYLKSGVKNVNGTSANVSFTIDVASLPNGSYKILVASQNTNNQASSVKYYYFQKENTVTLGKIIGLIPNTATLNQRQIFTISGTNLPQTIALSIQDCDQGSLSWKNSSEVTYSCIPRVRGSKLLYAKVKSGGTSLTNSSKYRVEVTNEVGASVDKASFSSETIPDRTVFNGGENFVKKWTVRNTGTSTWNSGYRLVYQSNTNGRLSQTLLIAIVGSIPPNATYTFSLPMKAPLAKSTNQTYIESWSFHSPSNQVIKIDSNSNIWTDIEVRSKDIVPIVININNFTVVAGDVDRGQVRVSFNVSSNKALTKIAITCGVGSNYSNAHIRNISSLGQGSKSELINDTQWKGKTVYCKSEVLAGSSKAEVKSDNVYLRVTPTEKTKITNFNISQDKKGSGKLNMRFSVSSGVSLSSIRAYCSTDSSLRTSSQYYYHSKNISASTGSKSTYITESNWVDDSVYCKVEVTESNGKKTLSSRGLVFMYKKTLTPPKITNFDLNEVGYGDGKLKATYNITADSSVSRVTVHCSRSSRVKKSSSYDYVSREGRKSTGSGSVELSHSDWDGETVYCKVEVFAGTNAYSNIERIQLKKKTTTPTEAPRLSSPRDGERITKTNPTYTWYRADGASTYRIYIKSTDGTDTVATGRTLGNTTYKKSSDFRVKSGKTYEWYMKSCDANYQNCISSTKRRFSVK